MNEVKLVKKWVPEYSFLRAGKKVKVRGYYKYVKINTADSSSNKATPENDVEMLAVQLHEKYESVSKKVGWKTQKECRTNFFSLPKENQKVMLAVATWLIKKHNKTVKDILKEIKKDIKAMDSHSPCNCDRLATLDLIDEYSKKCE